MLTLIISYLSTDFSSSYSGRMVFKFRRKLAKPFNINKLQTFQSKTLCQITKALFNVSNHTFHKDLNIPFVSSITVTHYKHLHSKIIVHPNPLINELASDNILGDPKVLEATLV